MNLKNKKIIFLIGASILVIAWLFISLFILLRPLSSTQQNSQNTQNTQTQTSPTPTPYAEQSEGYKNSTSQINKQSAPLIQHDSAVGTLLNKLPYKGTNFSMSYDFDTNSFVVIINKFNQDEGNKEFDTFLKNNGVMDRSWIKNLNLSYQ